MPENVLLFLPEIATLLGALATLLATIRGSSARGVWRVGLAFAAATVLASAWALDARGEPFFPHIYAVDAFSQVLKLGLAAGLALVLLVSDDLATLRPDARADVPFFLFLGTAGMMLLVSATELLTLYVALELSAYALYVLVGLGRPGRAPSEAAAKYVLFGAAASAVTLYGVSLLFGATGATYLKDVVALALSAPTPLLYIGLLLTLGGLLFKLAVFPFHAWAPDVYEAAPHQAVAFVATASKVAAVGLLARVTALAEPDPGHLVTVLVLLSVVSMTLGNLAAIVQRDLKRLLGWSAVTHAGYVLVGLMAFSEQGLASALFYGLVYLVMAFLPFLVVCALGRDGSSPSLESLAGLWQRSPFLAVVLLVGMFGLAGIPPTPGFAGKWFLFAAAVEQGAFWLVLVAALNATVSLYYYLLVVKAAWLAPAPDGAPPLDVPAPTRLAGALALLAVAWTGLYPAPVWELARLAAQAVLGG